MKKYIYSFSILTLLFFGAPLSFGAQNQSISAAELINNNCSRCHNLRSVQDFSANEWAVVIPHMRTRAHLKQSEVDAIVSYYQTLKATQVNKITSYKLSAKQVTEKYGCYGCHRIKGNGGSVGPELDSIVSEKGESFFYKKLKDAHFNKPDSPMPHMTLTDEEIETLLRYLSTKE